jgi:hypothetical protein
MFSSTLDLNLRKDLLEQLSKIARADPLRIGRLRNVTLSALHRELDIRTSESQVVARALQFLNSIAGTGPVSTRYKRLLAFLQRIEQGCSDQGLWHVLVDLPRPAQRHHFQGWLRQHPRFCARFVASDSTWLDEITPALAVLLAETLDCSGADALCRTFLDFAIRPDQNEAFLWMRDGSPQPQ